MCCRAARRIFSTSANSWSIFSPVSADAISTGEHSRKKILSRVSSTSREIIRFRSRCGLIKSHLFKTRIAALRCLWINPAIRLSWAVTPIARSIMRTHRSARRMLRSARMTLKTSTEVECFPRRRIPAVSMKTNFRPLRS